MDAPGQAPGQEAAHPPGDILGRLAELGTAGADTAYFHLYDVTDLDHVRLLGREISRRSPGFTTERAGFSPSRRPCGLGRPEPRHKPGALNLCCPAISGSI